MVELLHLQRIFNERLTEYVVLPIKYSLTSPEHWGRHVLIHGPPGAGKTYLIQAFVKELDNIPCFFFSTSDIVRKSDKDESWNAMQTIFEDLDSQKPCILVVDPFDFDNVNEHSPNFLPLFLSKLRRYEKYDIYVIFVTNKPFAIRTRIRRRFTNRVYVGLPSIDDRKRLIRNRVCDGGGTGGLSDQDLEEVCIRTNGLTCGDIICLCWKARVVSCPCLQKTPRHDLQNYDTKSGETNIKTNDVTSSPTTPCRLTRGRPSDLHIKEVSMGSNVRLNDFTCGDIVSLCCCKTRVVSRSCLQNSSESRLYENNGDHTVCSHSVTIEHFRHVLKYQHLPSVDAETISCFQRFSAEFEDSGDKITTHDTRVRVAGVSPLSLLCKDVILDALGPGGHSHITDLGIPHTARLFLWS